MADCAIIISTPDVSAVRDADRVIGIIDAKSEKAKNNQEVEKFVVINRLKPAMVKAGQMLSVEDILDILAVDLIGIVPEDENIIASTNMGEPIIYNQKSISAKAYQNIAKRVLGEEIEYLNLEVKKGIIEAIKGMFR